MSDTDRVCRSSTTPHAARELIGVRHGTELSQRYRRRVPDPSRLALFVGAALLLLVVPGPSVLYIVTQSISHGRRAGIVSVAGITTGTLVHIVAATVGLSALLASSALAFDVVKYLGAAYLIAVGIRRLAGWERERSREPERRDLGRLYRQGIVVNTLNPKTALFFLAFLPQFVDPARGAAVAADPRARPALRRARLPQRRRLGARRRDARRPPAPQPQLPAVQRYVSGSVFVGLGAVAALTAPVKQT